MATREIEVALFLWANFSVPLPPVCACRAGKPISASRAEGAVNQLVSARMSKRRPMRWSPRGARRVLQVRAVVLDGRPGRAAIQLAA